MAQPKSRRKAAHSASTTMTKASKSSSTPPAPFSRPPSSLAPFLSGLTPGRIYITHIDAHPPAFKRQIFLVPLLTNTVILLLLCWRIYAAAPGYVASISAFFEPISSSPARPISSSPARPVSLPLSTRAWAFVRTAAVVLADWGLGALAWAWPHGFFFGTPASPLLWRWSVRFAPREVVVRVSRRWSQGLDPTRDADLALVRDKVLPAVDRHFMEPRTGYMMLSRDWDLDYEAMLAAHALVGEEDVDDDDNKGERDGGDVRNQARETETDEHDPEPKMEDFRKSVFVHVPPYGWVVWDVWRLDEGTEDERRRKIVTFKVRYRRCTCLAFNCNCRLLKPQLAGSLDGSRQRIALLPLDRAHPGRDVAARRLHP